MKYIFLSIFVLFSNLQAHTLAEILTLQKQDNKTKSIEALRDAQVSQNGLITSYEAPRLGAGVSHAKEFAQEGVEYSVSFSQNLNNPLEGDEKRSLSKNLSKVVEQEAEHEMHIRELETASKYYGACSAKALSNEAQTLLQKHKKRVQSVEAAYKLGEVSKKAMLFNALEIAKAQKDARKYKSAYLQEFALLQATAGDIGLDSVDCGDIVEPKREIELKGMNEHAELQRFEYEKNAANSLEKLYDSALQNIGYELRYENELTTRRYTFGVNIPLTALTSQNELYKKAALEKRLSLNYSKESFKNETRAKREKLVESVGSLYEEYALFYEHILPLSQELLELSEYAYQEGEGTLMEYLDSSRSYARSRLEMLELKKNYYYELFELYKTTDTDFGEETCIK